MLSRKSVCLCVSVSVYLSISSLSLPPCIYVTGIESGMQNLEAKTTYWFCKARWGDRSGMPMGVQVSRHDLTAHAQRLFPPKQEADNCDIIS